MIRPLLFFTAVTLFALSGFSQSPTSGADNSSRSGFAGSSPATASNSPAAAMAAVSAPSGYVLTANDQVGVEVFGEDDLRTAGRLNSEGNLSVPLTWVGSSRRPHFGTSCIKIDRPFWARLSGKSPGERDAVGLRQAAFYDVRPGQSPGELRNARRKSGRGRFLEAIAMAGGYTRIAAPERITVKRASEVVKVNGKRLAHGSRDNFTVLPGDTVTVGREYFLGAAREKVPASFTPSC